MPFLIFGYVALGLKVDYIRAVKIRELEYGFEPDFIKSIIASYEFGQEKLEEIVKNFKREMREINTNRLFLLGSFKESPLSTVQLILRDADNNPELADGHEKAHVHALWVRKDYQRLGLATQMMFHCEGLARERGFRVLTLGVDDYNLSARALYEKLGYKVFREEEGQTPQEKLFLMKKSLF